MKKISKHLIALAIISLLVLPVFASTALAQPDWGINNVENGLGNTLQQGDPRTIIGKVINFALGFLGVIAVGIILFGGFKWMTAAGNEDKVSEAKKLLGAGIVGLIIILAAWAVATFIIAQIYSTTQGA